MASQQASPLAIVTAIIVLLVVLFVIYQLTWAKHMPSPQDNAQIEVGSGSAAPEATMNATGEAEGQQTLEPAINQVL
ncbi:hypothetical protein LLH03_08300 [bacterium]|nr:hypothetical protein [bacterium]